MKRLSQIEKIDILGVGVSAISLDDAVSFIRRAVGEGKRTYVCITGAHGLIECRKSPALRRIHDQAGLVTADGMPVLWCLRALGARGVTRVYGPDLMLAVCDAMRGPKGEDGARHYLYGGAPGIADRLAGRLRERFPGIAIAGTHCPPFRDLSDGEIDEICARINEAGAEIVWVGLSTPKQEFWMARVRDRLTAPVLVGVGAAFDFHAGVKRQAPPWMQRNGLEWLFRALSEPRRLGPRYLRIVPMFTMLALRQLAVARLRRPGPTSP